MNKSKHHRINDEKTTKTKVIYSSCLFLVRGRVLEIDFNGFTYYGLGSVKPKNKEIHPDIVHKSR